jgi:hypothetical protein
VDGLAVVGLIVAGETLAAGAVPPAATDGGFVRVAARQPTVAAMASDTTTAVTHSRHGGSAWSVPLNAHSFGSLETITGAEV